ncbi:mucin-5AC isoform X2 [Solenopsis invicta]|uniref:mucin-5AC isoform X2 n=1 Tax=Solenopsis invicta TaxID=13686 RepID=UPI000595E0BE|nr:mucin-5AC isoform X2 [Solenopsis invicta]
MGKPLHLIVILQLSSAFAYRYDPWYRADTQRPVDVITDVVNELGVRILQQYSTRGNVAFSPTGVAFVLAALYEGSAGRGSQQIAEAIGLPPNRDVTRIGFRDIHRRLRSYLNADGFLGGLTLSRENTRLRPEYEDILRFYGFDLSSIEQEANVTVSMGDSAGVTELPTSTIGLTTLPSEMVNTGNVPDMTTTTLTGAITTLPPAGAETTVVPSTATGTTQQTVTTTEPTGATGVQSTLTPITTVGTVNQNVSQPANSPTTIASGESVQTSTTTGTETVADSPNTITPMTNTDSQTIPTTTVVAVSGAATSPTAAGDSGTGSAVSNENVVPMSTSAGTTTTTAAADAGATVPMSTDVQVPSTSPPNTEVPTNMPGTTTTIAADASTDSLAAASTIDVSMTPANVPIPNATLSTVTMNSLTTVVPAISNSANVTIPSPVTETMMANGVISQSSTAPSVDTSAGNTLGMTAANDPATTMTTMINIDDAIAVNSTMTAMANATSSGPAGNDLPPIANSTSPMNNQTTASLVDENTISMNRKRKDLADIINSNTVKDESTDGSPNLRKREARSPRGYFSSYPDEGIWMQNLEIWKSYNTVNPADSSIGDSSAEMSFLVNGCEISSVSASRYIAVLPFAYFPSLQAVALEFPLDDPRYNIILFMPTDKTDTHRLARDLSGKPLRLLRKRLQPTWVRATIPSFMLRGFVTLTSFLQRLGILDVFEPRVADLSPMTSDLGVYARDVQQSIGVNIRNYMKPDRTHSRESPNVVPPRRDYYRYLPPGNGLFERAGPEPFTALHPFLYFIVDTETSVSLITGRVDDPLNSRIL